MEIKESSDSLFHFTSKYENIVSILNEKFKPFFCIEDLSFMYDNSRKMTFAIPMVCFCDIPIERHKPHKEKYGGYGIGLKKVWGINNGLNIVNYSYNLSYRSSSFRILTNLYTEIRSININEWITKFNNSFSLLLMTTKPYEGLKFDNVSKLWSKEIYRFYDEREWRYLPLADGENWSYCLYDYDGNHEKFFDEIKEGQHKLQTNHKLNFCVDDIEFIFLKTKDEKKKLLNDISENYTVLERNKIEKLIQVECKKYIPCFLKKIIK